MRKIFPVISFFFIVAFFSCKKNQLGGKSTLSGTVFHHSKKIPDAKIYIKFNAQEFPGTDVSKYDTQTTSDVNGFYTLNFYKGNYYLYAVGKDYAIAAPYIVEGGIAVKLRTNEKVELNIYVTEGD